MYGDETPSVPALGAARFDGLALLQNAAVLYAVRDCKDANCRKAVNSAIAVNQARERLRKRAFMCKCACMCNEDDAFVDDDAALLERVWAHSLRTRR
jgi:hypothetical protein